MLCHLSAAVVDLQQIADLIDRPIIAAAVPQVTTKQQNITRIAQDRLQQSITPLFLGSGWFPPRPVTPWYDLRGAQLFRLRAEIEVGRAKEHGEADF